MNLSLCHHQYLLLENLTWSFEAFVVNNVKENKVEHFSELKSSQTGAGLTTNLIHKIAFKKRMNWMKSVHIVQNNVLPLNTLWCYKAWVGWREIKWILRRTKTENSKVEEGNLLWKGTFLRCCYGKVKEWQSIQTGKGVKIQSRNSLWKILDSKG